MPKMGRIRTQRQDLPRRMYHYHGAYYFVDKAGKRTHLGRDFAGAIIKYAAIVQAPVAKMRLSGVMDIYTIEVIPTKKERTQADYHDAVARLRPVFGQMWPEDVEPHHIYQYLDSRSAKVRGNREIAVLSNIMQLAVRKGLIKANPCKQVKRNPEPRKGSSASDTQINAFKPFCPDWLQAYIDLKLLIGLRQGDMLRLTLFNLRDDGLYCLTSKRDKGLLFQWTPALRAAVDRCKELRRKPSEPSLFGKSQNTFKAAWQYAMGKAVAAGVERFAEKDLRSRVACDAIESGRDATTLLAHSNDAVTRRHYQRGTTKVAPLR